MEEEKTVRLKEANWDYLWKIKRRKKLKSLDEVISFIREKIGLPY